MTLEDQDEVGFAVLQHEAARLETDLEVDRTDVASGGKSASTLVVLRVALDVENAIEARRTDAHVYLHSVRQTVDDDIGSGGVRSERWWLRDAS